MSVAEIATIENLRLLAALPPGVLSTLPATSPPPGVKPNFQHPETRVPSILSVGFTFLTVATIFTFVRWFVKLRVHKQWRPEDTCLSIAYVAMVINWVGSVQSLILGQLGRHAYELHLDTVLFPGWSFAIWCNRVLWCPVLGLCKVTILLQFWQLFSPKRWMRVCIYIAMGLTVPFYLGTTIALIYSASPAPGQSNLYALVAWRLDLTVNLVYPIGIFGAVMDWVLLLLPLPAIASLQMSTSRKLGIMMIFLTGSVACVASIICCVYRYSIDFSDSQWTNGLITLWTQVELCTSIIVASMPAFHQFWHRHHILVRFSDLIKSSVSNIVQRSRSGFSSNQSRNKQSTERRSEMAQIPSLASADVPGSPNNTRVLDSVDEKDAIMVHQTYSVSRTAITQNSESDYEELDNHPRLPIQRP